VNFLEQELQRIAEQANLYQQFNQHVLGNEEASNHSSDMEGDDDDE
jgi:hypothetical protein